PCFCVGGILSPRFSFTMRPLPISTLFPYTTLFRSVWINTIHLHEVYLHYHLSLAVEGNQFCQSPSHLYHQMILYNQQRNHSLLGQLFYTNTPILVHRS